MTDDLKNMTGGWIRVPLDAESMALLDRLSNLCGEPAVTVASSLLHDILRDDALAHADDPAGTPASVFN